MTTNTGAVATTGLLQPDQMSITSQPVGILSASALQSTVEKAFADKFPPRYTSILEIVPGSFTSYDAGTRQTFRFVAKEYNGSFFGKKILKGEKVFVGVYKPETGPVIEPEVTYTLQSSGGVPAIAAAPSAGLMSPEGITKLEAVVKEIDATAKKLQQDRDKTVATMMHARLTPEGSARLQAKLVVIDVQLKALAAKKSSIERLKKIA